MDEDSGVGCGEAVRASGLFEARALAARGWGARGLEEVVEPGVTEELR